MDNVYRANVSSQPPEIPADAPKGYPTDGSSTGSSDATVPGAQWYHAVTSEIRNAIEAGGVSPNRNKLNQLAQAIAKQDLAIYSSLLSEINELKDRIDSQEVESTGLIGFFATASPPNAYWLICDGSAVSRAAYKTLFLKIGTTYGAGNGSTTFNLPNLIGKTVWGAQASVGTALQAGLPNVTGYIGGSNAIRSRCPDPTFFGAFYDGGSSIVLTGDTGTVDRAFCLRFDASRANAIYGRSSTVQPPALKLLPCIHI